MRKEYRVVRRKPLDLQDEAHWSWLTAPLVDFHLCGPSIRAIKAEAKRRKKAGSDSAHSLLLRDIAAESSDELVFKRAGDMHFPTRTKVVKAAWAYVQALGLGEGDWYRIFYDHLLNDVGRITELDWDEIEGDTLGAIMGMVGFSEGVSVDEGRRWLRPQYAKTFAESFEASVAARGRDIGFHIVCDESRLRTILRTSQFAERIEPIATTAGHELPIDNLREAAQCLSAHPCAQAFPDELYVRSVDDGWQICTAVMCVEAYQQQVAPLLRKIHELDGLASLVLEDDLGGDRDFYEFLLSRGWQLRTASDAATVWVAYPGQNQTLLMLEMRSTGALEHARESDKHRLRDYRAQGLRALL